MKTYFFAIVMVLIVFFSSGCGKSKREKELEAQLRQKELELKQQRQIELQRQRELDQEKSSQDIVEAVQIGLENAKKIREERLKKMNLRECSYCGGKGWYWGTYSSVYTVERIRCTYCDGKGYTKIVGW